MNTFASSDFLANSTGCACIQVCPTRAHSGLRDPGYPVEASSWHSINVILSVDEYKSEPFFL